MLKELKNIHKVHFVGIGGAGMSPLAKILTEMGYEVTGSDRSESEIIAHLRELGATVYIGQDGEHVRGVDAIVVSSAIPYDNPEVLAAGQLGIPKLHSTRSAYLRPLSSEARSETWGRMRCSERAIIWYPRQTRATVHF